MAVSGSGVMIGKTYFLNLYDGASEGEARFHESFEEAVVAARKLLSEQPEAKLWHILEVEAIKGLEPLELYP